SRSKLTIHRDGLIEVINRLLPSQARVLIKEVLTFQIEAIRLWIDRRRGFMRSYQDINPPRDVGRDIVLEIEYLAHIAFIGFSPEVHVSRDLNQLCSNANAIAGAGHRAFHDSVDVEFAPDFLDGLFRSLVAHDRGSRGDTDTAQLGQIRDQGVGHPVGKIFLFRIMRQVFKGNHGQRGNLYAGVNPLGYPSLQSPKIEGQRADQDHDNDA